MATHGAGSPAALRDDLLLYVVLEDGAAANPNAGRPSSKRGAPMSRGCKIFVRAFIVFVALSLLALVSALVANSETWSDAGLWLIFAAGVIWAAAMAYLPTTDCFHDPDGYVSRLVGR
ncbi:hypothetical protein ACP70R_044350 [Stipagrostis hirtigluma subsp. patula]